MKCQNDEIEICVRKKSELGDNLIKLINIIHKVKSQNYVGKSTLRDKDISMR